MKFYILGSSGFIGGICAKYLKGRGHQVCTDRIDVNDFFGMKSKFKSLKPDAVINFAGVRAYPNIDWCEDHKEETVKVNVAGAINAMLAAIDAGAYPIQISSGCIYTGGKDKLYAEEDEPNFFGSFYSRMKIVMQKAFQELPVLQVRIRMPISIKSNPRNLINKLILYKKVISIPNSVTLVEDFVAALEKLSLEDRPVGILNLTNDGYLEHPDILDSYKRIVDPGHSYEQISMEEFFGKENRQGLVKTGRSNCLLSNEKAKSFGISMPALDKKRLDLVMAEYKKSLL